MYIPPRISEKLIIRVLIFALGVVVGSCLAFLCFYEFRVVPRHLDASSRVVLDPFKASQAGFNETQARLLCVVRIVTNNVKHLTAINETFAQRCSKLVFYSQRRPQRPKPKVTKKGVVLPITADETVWEGSSQVRVLADGKAHPDSWLFLRLLFKDLAVSFIENVDWVTVVDDRSYLVVDNLNPLLTSRNPSRPLFLGRRLRLRPTLGFFLPFLRKDYLSAKAGYVMSRSTVENLVGALDAGCQGWGWWDSAEADVSLAHCLRSLGVPATDGADSLRGGHRFLDESFRRLLPASTSSAPAFQPLYSMGLFRRTDVGPCCSDHAVVFGDLSNKDIRLLHYALYILRPFGSFGDNFLDKLLGI